MLCIFGMYYYQQSKMLCWWRELSPLSGKIISLFFIIKIITACILGDSGTKSLEKTCCRFIFCHRLTLGILIYSFLQVLYKGRFGEEYGVWVFYIHIIKTLSRRVPLGKMYVRASVSIFFTKPSIIIREEKFLRLATISEIMVIRAQYFK